MTNSARADQAAERDEDGGQDGPDQSQDKDKGKDQDAPLSREFLHRVAEALRLSPRDLEDIAFRGAGVLPYALPVDDFAAGTVAAAGASLRALMGLHAPFAAPASAGDAATAGIDAAGGVAVDTQTRHPSASLPRLTIDRRLAGLWFGTSLQPTGWTLPPIWDSVAGDYRAADGWIRLHTNADRHRAAALSVLGCAEDRAAVAAAVARWSAQDLESAVIAAGGCAAVMHTRAQWRAHPQGKAVAAEPLIAWTEHPLPAVPASRPAPNRPLVGDPLSGHPFTGHPSTAHPLAPRPLAGLKVLDLTRILAGPVSTRFLAGYGADVLRIDPPGWDEPSLAPDITLGKRCARLDLRVPADRARFESLLAGADVLVHGYRPGALAGLGYDAAARRAINPALIDVTLDAYGWSGPWQGRRGFDSLVQMSSGIAHAGMVWRGADKPTPMPAQALDHGTGYLIAAAVLRGLAMRLTRGIAVDARLSLARTAEALFDLAEPRGDQACEERLGEERGEILREAGQEAGREGRREGGQGAVQEAREAARKETRKETREQARTDRPLEKHDADFSVDQEATAWGPALRARPPLDLAGSPMHWDYPAGPLGAALPEWKP